MNRGRTNQETRVDVPIRNDEKQKILPKSIYKKEKTGRKKMRLEFEKTAKLLTEEKNLKNECKIIDKSNNNDHPIIPMNGLDDFTNEESRPKFFGVKNYLHNFYESVNLKNPQLYEDIPDESEANQPFKENKYCKLYWKIGICAAVIIAFIGLILILVGFVTPLHTSVADKNAEFLVMDKSDTTLNDYMRVCRLVGIALFIVGFTLFLAVVLLALCSNLNDDNNECEDEESDHLCLSFNTDNTYQKGPDEKIPVTEELTTVQVKREKEDVVVTSAGLCTPSALQIK